MNEDGRKHALPCVVIEPDNKDTKPNCIHTMLPCYPPQTMVGLNIRHNMKNPPNQPQDKAGCQCAPPLLHGIDGISHPPHLFTYSGNKEHYKKYRYQQKWNVRFIREW